MKSLLILFLNYGDYSALPEVKHRVSRLVIRTAKEAEIKITIKNCLLYGLLLGHVESICLPQLCLIISGYKCGLLWLDMEGITSC